MCAIFVFDRFSSNLHTHILQDQAFIIPCPVTICQDFVGESVLIFFPNAPRNYEQFESLISNTIEETKDIPEIISETGKIGMPHKGDRQKRSIYPCERHTDC